MKPSRSHSIPGDCSLEVKCQGFLEKQGRLIGSFMGKKYWCVLDSHRLSYYKHADKVCPQWALVGRRSVRQLSEVGEREGTYF